MPLAMLNVGDEAILLSIMLKKVIKKHLEDIGFIKGEKVSIITKTDAGNMIVRINDVRMAIGHEMSSKMMVRCV